ncbi:CxxH/CxxC protein [Jeotgalibacillus haloalkalitolerans]|uniref:CxxH/CxxC protein n=1 Tax=Jeotgalibacillus haloalkalitolerans TaxID=3104292 RepID=A0ABU5KHA8_9BACL|nr:CxxH/CxxC protein [Jeotgalibacillus sp. HH7-29]MDZ5710629.1 CxxH/CxxC protein [Jeotgalibacillus sp. HH7-29]
MTHLRIFCCKEHVELALDVLVDETEDVPLLKTVDNYEELSTNCEYCNETAIYLVENK